MTILRPKSDTVRKLSLAEIVETVSDGDIPLRFTAYDGSATGPEDAPYGLHLNSERGTTYLATAPATSVWPAPTSPATSRPSASTPATRTKS